MNTKQISVGVPMFSREQALTEFLESVPKYVTTAYIADNGHTDEHWHIYERDWPFRVEVIDLEYDVGIGPCRAAIVDAVEEPYLWVGDNDMEFINKNDLKRLQTILELKPELGGVAAWLKEGNYVRSGASDIYRHKNTVYKAVADTKQIANKPDPHARFDMIPQAALFKTNIFRTYSWDTGLTDTEHFDFFYGHKRADEWQFASTPSVVVLHKKGINQAYRKEKDRTKELDMQRLGRKWGIADIQVGPRPDWVTTRQRSAADSAFDAFRKAMPPSVWIPVRRTLERVGIA